MTSVSQGVSFEISSDYVETVSKKFDNNQDIIVYVEGFEDIPFWEARFDECGVNVQVKSFAVEHKANGKGTIFSAINSGTIKLGSYLVVAVDSDYDYILGLDEDKYQSNYVFQTYAYSIENLMWHPNRLTHICRTAAKCTHHIDNSQLGDVVESWSNAVFPEFVRFLHDINSSQSIDRILGYLNSRTNVSVR